MKGFTFVEFLLVMTIIVVLLALTIPLGISFYQSQQLNITAEEIIQALRRAQLKSMSQSEHSFGVYLGSGQSGQYVLFRGNSYASRDDEEIFDIPDDISFSGLSEVVFSKLNGIPSVSDDIILINDSNTGVININEAGRISYAYTSSQGCWGIGGSCDSLCQYANYGSLTSYYINPGCTSTCSAAGSFYINPNGACSIDGTAFCYKMENSLMASTTCSQGVSCGGACSGTCTPCVLLLGQSACINQRGCSWLSLGGGKGRCTGTCLPCSDPYFNTRVLCENQVSCSWADKWYWNLTNSQAGYSSYISCIWY
jgi:prepilin-type N-terminal cleavage/methylation domain-containing protein